MTLEDCSLSTPGVNEDCASRKCHLAVSPETDHTMYTTLSTI